MCAIRVVTVLEDGSPPTEYSVFVNNVIWTGICEVLLEPGELPSGCRKAFVRITTWADSQQAVERKVSQYFDVHKWKLISMEGASPIDQNREYGDETADLIARTRDNPKAIILGRFHSYKEN